MDRFETIKAELEKRYRTFRLIPKEESAFMKTLYYGALMFLWCPEFMADYTTVIIARVGKKDVVPYWGSKPAIPAIPALSSVLYLPRPWI